MNNLINITEGSGKYYLSPSGDVYRLCKNGNMRQLMPMIKGTRGKSPGWVNLYDGKGSNKYYRTKPLLFKYYGI